MSVVMFPVKTTADIPGEARDFADKAEAGEFGNLNAAIVITSGGSLQCHYWGDGVNIVEAIAMLECAKMNLVRKMCE